jgi:hypothetical protein
VLRRQASNCWRWPKPRRLSMKSTGAPCAFLQDPNIGAVIVGLDPTAPSGRALEQSELRPGYDIGDSKQYRAYDAAAGGA